MARSVHDEQAGRPQSHFKSRGTCITPSSIIFVNIFKSVSREFTLIMDNAEPAEQREYFITIIIITMKVKFSYLKNISGTLYF